MNFIDYSQYWLYSRCKWEWYERYVNKRVPKREARQRDDNLALGSLVHNGLDNWTRARKIEIEAKVIEEINPTPECYSEALQLVQGYVRRYPSEEWELERVEEPLTFPLQGSFVEDVVGLAKLDAYFYNPEQRDLETGLDGSIVSIQPGWWAREYKTKSAGVKRGLWNQSWQSNMQASFQLLALQEKVRAVPQGVLVSVLEKPRVYVPKRKCKGCGENWEMASYISTGDGQHSCPMCGHRQALKPYEPKTSYQSEFYRLVVSRTAGQLETALYEIGRVAEEMEEMRLLGMEAAIPDREECVHKIFGECDYFKNHTYGISTEEDPMMVEEDTLRYVGLEEAA